MELTKKAKSKIRPSKFMMMQVISMSTFMMKKTRIINNILTKEKRKVCFLIINFCELGSNIMFNS